MEEHNRGGRINDNIINNTPVVDAGICSAGLMAGVTSASKRWHRTTTPDPELAEYGPVREWLHILDERIRAVFALSNIYQALADGTYPDLAIFGFHCTILDEDLKTVIRAESLPMGEYVLATDAHGRVDTVFRELPLTVRQVVQRFGLNNCSSSVRNQYARSNYEQVVKVSHCIYPNQDYTPGRADRFGKKWASNWFETSGREDKFLKQSGYEQNPIIAPAWLRKGNEPYARGPGSNAIGDAKTLQYLEEKLADMIDKTVDPPMKGSAALNNGRASLVAGDITYMPPGQDSTFEPSVIISPAAIVAMERHIDRYEYRIGRALHTDLFKRIIDDERAQRATAREIEEGHNETMQLMGPVLGRLDSELLRPMIDRAYFLMDTFGLIPEPPKEIQGVELKVEFDSTMHQAQKKIGLGSVREFIAEVKNLAELRPDAVEKLNSDEIVDEIAEMAGIKPDMVLSDDQVAEKRAERQAREQAAVQGEALLNATQGAKNLGTTPAPADDNALGAVLSQLGGAVEGVA